MNQRINPKDLYMKEKPYILTYPYICTQNQESMTTN